MTLKEFFQQGKVMTERYNATKDVLENEIKQKEIAQAIETRLTDAIFSVDTDKLNISIDVESLPSFGFDKSQKEEMIRDICATIRSEQYTLGDFINAKTERIDVIKETLVGGVNELFDEVDVEYKYEKKLEEERRNLLLITELMSNIAEDKEKAPEEIKDILNTNTSIRSLLKYNVPARTLEDKMKELKAALTAYAILKSQGVEIDNKKAAETFAKMRVNIDNGENMFDRLENHFAATFDDVKKSFPELSTDLSEIKEMFFSRERDASQAQTSGMSIDKEIEQQIKEQMPRKKDEIELENDEIIIN